MSNALPLKRKQEDETSLPDAKKQRVGGYRSYHDPMASMPHAMEMYDSALAMHQAMKQPQQAMSTAYQQPYGGDSSGYYYGSAQSNNAGYYYQQSTNSTMKNNHYYPNETTQAAQPAQTYQQTHYTHSHNALEPGAINTLHASGFPEQASEDDVKRLFSNQPGYMDLSFRAPPGKRPCAWILFQSVDYAVSAKAMLDGTQVYGKSIRVGYAKSEMKSKRGSAPSPMHSMNYSQVPQASVYDRKMAYNSPHGQQSYASRPNNPYQTTPGGPTAAINTLYITSLSYQTGEGDVRSMLQDFEGYRGMSFVQKSGRNPHAFVLFTDSQTATVALNAINGKMLHGRPIRVQYAKSEMHARNAR